MSELKSQYLRDILPKEYVYITNDPNIVDTFNDLMDEDRLEDEDDKENPTFVMSIHERRKLMLLGVTWTSPNETRNEYVEHIIGKLQSHYHPIPETTEINLRNPNNDFLKAFSELTLKQLQIIGV